MGRVSATVMVIVAVAITGMVTVMVRVTVTQSQTTGSTGNRRQRWWLFGVVWHVLDSNIYGQG